MNFHDLNQRFVRHLRDRVRSGEVTERGLARLAGVSQPHLHHVLKGKRLLSSEMADKIMRRLEMDLLDLLSPTDLSDSRRPH